MLGAFNLTLLFSQKSDGIASFYDNKFEGRPTSSGEIFSQAKLTAAHRNLPYGTMVKVVNLENMKSVVVRINDRGPFVDNRLIDLSESAAKELGFINSGLAHVSIEIVGGDNSIMGENETHKADKKSSDLKFPNEYYEIDIKFAKPIGFAIQVGSFTELANLMRMSQELQRIYGKNLLVQVTDVNEKKVHRLLVGPYSERTSAEAMQEKLKQNYPNCFVLGL